MSRNTEILSKKGKKVKWYMGKMAKTNEATSPRPLPENKKRKEEIVAGDIEG